eukprot:2994343-Pleurochrysis_carterae.AAC.2
MGSGQTFPRSTETVGGAKQSGDRLDGNLMRPRGKGMCAALPSTERDMREIELRAYHACHSFDCALFAQSAVSRRHSTITRAKRPPRAPTSELVATVAEGADVAAGGSCDLWRVKAAVVPWSDVSISVFNDDLVRDRISTPRSSIGAPWLASMFAGDSDAAAVRAVAAAGAAGAAEGPEEVAEAAEQAEQAAASDVVPLLHALGADWAGHKFGSGSVEWAKR